MLGSRAKSPLAANAVMFSRLVPVFVSVTDCAAAVVPTTVLPKVKFDGLSDTPEAMPVPVSVMICVPPLLLSLIVIPPVRVPLATGVKFTAIMQLPPATTGVDVEQVVLGSRAKSPLEVKELMFSGLLPVLVIVTDCAAAVVPTTVLPKVRLEGLRETPATAPVPLSVIVCRPPLTLSAMVTTPVRVPLAAGVNVTAIVHVPEAATGVEVEQVVPVPRAKSPLAVNELMFRTLVPVFVSVTDWAAAVVPTTVLPKVRLDGFRDTPATAPVPLSAMVCVPPLALSRMVNTPVRVLLAVGANVTAIVHVPEAATGIEVEHVVPVPRAKSPLELRAEMLSGLLPVFVNVTDCAAAVAPTTVLPKARLEGLSDTPAWVPVPLSITT